MMETFALELPAKAAQRPAQWEETELGEFIAAIEAGKSFKCLERPPEDNEVGVAKVSAVTWGEYQEQESKTCLDTKRIQERLFIREGDFLFSRANTVELVGACVIAKFITRSVMLSDKILRLKFSGMLPRFVLFYLRSKQGRRQIELLSTGNQKSMRNIGQERIRAIRTPVPPFAEQRRIVAKIEELFSELDKGVETLKTARAQLKTYRQSLLKAAFEGSLTEQWRRDNADKLETADQFLQRIREERKARYQKQLEEWKAAVAEWEANGKPGKKPTKPSVEKPLPDFETDELEVLPKLPKAWRNVRLATIASVGSGMSVSKSRKLSDPIEVAYLRVANVQRGRLVLDEIKTMPIEQEALRDLQLKKWDILFNEGGDRDKLGRGWVWEEQVEPCITQNHVFRATTYLGDEYHAKFVS